MSIDEILDGLNIDKHLTLDRFCNNQVLLLRFLKKFPLDPNFYALKEAVDQNAYTQIEYSAHTLKGIAANLGFDELAYTCSSLVLAMRNQEFDSLIHLFKSVAEEYNRIIKYIEKID